MSKAEDTQSDDPDEGANLREWRWHYDRDTKLPNEFVEDFEKSRSLALQAWQAARSDDDFDAFKPHLDKMIQFNREQADYWGYADCRYDALLDTYERGATTARLTATFDELKAGSCRWGFVQERSRPHPIHRRCFNGCR